MFLFTGGFAVVFQDFTQDKLVGVFAERVPEHGRRNKIHVAVGAFRLVGAGTVKIPLWEIYNWRNR